MTKEELRERYEALGDERDYAEAVPLYQEALAGRPDDPVLLGDYGYLQYCHGRQAIRAAAGCYERAIAADPASDKPCWQLIGALAALGESDQAVARFRLLADQSPADLRGYRFLASACLHAADYGQAAAVIGSGLALDPEDAALAELRGDLYAATGNPQDALAWWRRAFELAPADYGISMRYSAADLLEREGRLAEAAGEWRFIVTWCQRNGAGLAADWPRRELARLEAEQPGA